jgi:hypothetical protein
MCNFEMKPNPTKGTTTCPTIELPHDSHSTINKKQTIFVNNLSDQYKQAGPLSLKRYDQK